MRFVPLRISKYRQEFAVLAGSYRALRTAALLFLFALISLGAIGQTYRIDRFDSERGLDQSYIYTVIQDEKGFLWVGTGAGLYRFDGADFEAYTTEQGLAEDFTTCSFRDSKGRIWFGHFEGGLSLLEDLNPKPVIPNEMLNSSIAGIAEDSRGKIWLAAQTNGLTSLDENLKPKNFSRGFEDIRIFSFAITEKNQILLGTDSGLLVYLIDGKGNPIFSRKVEGIPETKITSISKRTDRPGFWIATEDAGLCELIPGESAAKDLAQRFSPENGFPLENIQCVFEDAKANVWVGTFGQGFRKFIDSDPENRLRPVMPLSSADSAGSDIIKHIFADKFGQLWFGTYGGGLLCLAEETFSIFHLESDTLTTEVYTTMEDHAGHLWFGTNRGLLVVDRDRIADNGNHYALGKPLPLPVKRRYTMDDGLPSNHITALLEDRHNEVWVGTRRNGLCRVNTTRDTIHPVEFSSISLSRVVNAIREDDKGNVWIATSDGAYEYDIGNGKTNYFSTRNGLAHNNIYDIFPDSKGRIWFATHTNNVTVYSDGNFQRINVGAEGEVPNVNCIAEDKKGNIWLGTDGHGLYRFDGKVFENFNEAHGMISNYVYFLVIDRYENIWMAHRNGMTRHIPETGAFVPYENTDYFPFEENPLYSAYMDMRGNIWYGSGQGMIRYNWIPERTRVAPPFTFIREMRVFDELQNLEEGLQFPYKSYRVKFSFLGLTFLGQDQVRYKYKLEGRAPEWSDLSPQTSVSFQSLEDGEYTFMVKACNSLGKCNENAARFSFSIAPPYWKTWWFRILVVLVLAAILFLYVKYRVYRLNKEKSALEAKVRERTVELRKEKEKVEEANLQLEKLSLVASETDNAVFILDAEGNLEWINQGFTRMTGYSFEELLELRKGRNFLETSTNPKIRNLLREVIENNTSAQYESQLPTKDGRQIWVLSTLTPILDTEGELRNIVIIDSNITERKLAEQQVKEMNTELERLVEERTHALADANIQLQKENEEHIKTAEQLRLINQELDHFVYRASHDLKGPLASMMGLIIVARDELKENDMAQTYLDLMERAGTRLDKILVDLILATQVKQGKIEFSRFNVLELVQNVIESLSNRRDFSEVEFTLKIEPELEVISDRKLLHSLVQNFVDNSIKYRDEKKEQATSEVIVEMKDEMILIQVQDNGIGIKEELQEKVFNMFFRGTNQAGGSGLGLYIVKQATEKLDGNIEMESEYGVGTTIRAIIPNRTEADIEIEEEVAV